MKNHLGLKMEKIIDNFIIKPIIRINIIGLIIDLIFISKNTLFPIYWLMFAFISFLIAQILSHLVCKFFNKKYHFKLNHYLFDIWNKPITLHDLI